MGFYDEILVPNNGSEHSMGTSERGQISTGVVKENWNEEAPGLIKVEFVIGEKGAKESYWIRVMTPYCGNGFGFYHIPEIGSEVVVGYIMGDKDQPIVLGCLWNSQIKLPDQTADKDNSLKKWKTKGGNEITISEEEGKEKIEVKTKNGLQLKMDDEIKSILFSDKEGENTLMIDGKNGEVQIVGKNKVEFTAGSSKLTMDGSGNKIIIDGGQIQIGAKQSLELKGQSLKEEGSMVEITAKGNLKVESSGIASIKGSMLKLN